MDVSVKFVLIVVTLPIMFAVDPIILDLLTPVPQLGEKCGYESCYPLKEGWTNIHIVPHTHAEMGRMKTFLQHYTGHDDFYLPTQINMKKVFDATVTELWADKTRKFTISSSELPYFFFWWGRRDGTVRRMVYELIRQGRLAIVGGGWGMSDEACTSYQSIIDSYTYSMRKINSTFLWCGRPRVAWQSDTFGHSREYASLIAQMGFDGLFISPLSFDDELLRMERKALEFIWRGSDDLGSQTDLYTHKLFDGYAAPPGFCFGGACDDPLMISSDTMFSNIAERIDQFVNSIRHRQAPYYKTNHIMVVMGQRHSYFDAKLWFANIDKLIFNFNKRTHLKKEKMYAVYSNPLCYLRAVYEDNPVLETKQDDFIPLAVDKDSYTTGAYTSRPTFKYMVRESNIFLQMVKQLQVLLNLGNTFDDMIEEFNWIMGVVQDHNIITGAMRQYVSSYYTQRLYDTTMWSTVLLQKAFNQIRGSPPSTKYILCYFNMSSCPNTYLPDSFYITVYNLLGWHVTMPIRLPVKNKMYEVFDSTGTMTKAILMTTPEHIFKIPSREFHATKELVFIAQNIPALGLKSYFIQSHSVRVKKSLIKKISKNQQKKYIVRQVPKENRTLLGENYDYYDDEIKPGTKIEFGNIDKLEENIDYDGVVTPKYKLDNGTTLKSVKDNDANITETTTSVNISNDTVTEESTPETVNSTEPSLYSTEPSITEDIVDALNDTINSSTTNELYDELTTEIPRETTSSTTLPNSSYYITESKDNFISNKYIRINLDSYRKITSINLSNGINSSLDIQYYYYVSDEPPLRMNDEYAGQPEKRRPGAYVFRPVDANPEPIIDFIDAKVYKSDIVQEIHTKYSNYASFAIKLYVDSPIIEVDWVIGPVPEDDSFGKEVFIRYTVDLENNGIFYTDANGRQTMKRLRHLRPLYEPYQLDPVAGNFYPVTSRIYIEDLQKNLRFSIFNDRSQGGASLLDGAIDLMVIRRIFTDDTGVQTFLNETEDGIGIIVRGSHYLYLTKSDTKQNRVYEKKFAKEVEFIPRITVNRISQMEPKDAWIKRTNEFTALKSKLPIGVHLLTIQEWNDKSLLLRLENYLEKVDVVKSGIKRVHLKDLFINIKLLRVEETTLSGNILLKDYTQLNWSINGSFVRNFNEFYGTNNTIEFGDEVKSIEDVDLNEAITLVPQQIRTFVIHYEYLTNKDKDNG